MGIKFRVDQKVKAVALNSEFGLSDYNNAGSIGSIGTIHEIVDLGEGGIRLVIQYVQNGRPLWFHPDTVVPLDGTPLNVEVREIIMEFKKLGYTYEQIETIVLDVFKKRRRTNK